MTGSISYTLLRIPARCLRGRVYFSRGVCCAEQATVITPQEKGAILVGERVRGEGFAGRVMRRRLPERTGCPPQSLDRGGRETPKSSVLRRCWQIGGKRQGSYTAGNFPFHDEYSGFEAGGGEPSPFHSRRVWLP